MRIELIFFMGLAVVLLAASVSAAASSTMCAPKVELFNQDPYPANPSEYVKVVFQVTGLENPDCKKATFALKEDFPFTLDPNAAREIDFFGRSYVRNYNSSALVPFTLRVDPDAIDGNNEIEAVLTYELQDGRVISQIAQFDINVEGVTVDFEVSVKDFDYSSNTLTFEILNTGESDVEALVVDVPKQDTLVVKGTSRNIIGSLDANDDTTFRYEAVPQDGDISLAISYTDSIQERRTMMKKVYFDSTYFTGRKADEVQPKSTYFYLFYVLLVLVILGFVRNWWKKRKKKEREKSGKK